MRSCGRGYGEAIPNELSLNSESARKFGGSLYRDLPQKVADSFDDFEIEYDVIEDATDEELKEFFQRLQAGLPLTSSEKLNALHSRLRDYCRIHFSRPQWQYPTLVTRTLIS
jgi:hypothetical protein